MKLLDRNHRKPSPKEEERYKQYELFSRIARATVSTSTIKIVKTRTEHNCFVPGAGEVHLINVGSYTRYEAALYYDKWWYYWTCLECIDKYTSIRDSYDKAKKADVCLSISDTFDSVRKRVGDNTKSFDEYDNIVLPLAKYPGIGNNFVYPALGLAGESGEVVDKIKKVLRDKDGVLSSSDKTSIIKELGDVLWYISALASELDSSLQEVAATNIYKLLDRNKRGVIQGEGDDR